MERTRTGIVAGARAGIVRDGVRRLSMATVAELGGIAKATVYNHVRSKPDLLALVARDLVYRIDTAALAAPSLVTSLAAAARAAAADDVVRAVADDEPAVVGRLLRVLHDPVFDDARRQITALLERHGVDVGAGGVNVDLVLRWVLSTAAAPGSEQSRTAQAALLADALPRVPATP